MSCTKSGIIEYNGTDTITSVKDACVKCGIIRWQSSTDGIEWTTIPNETLQTLTVEPSPTLVYYRRGIAKAKESCKDCKYMYSNIVEVVTETYISGIIWDDVNKNGLRQGGEAIFPGVVIEIWDEPYSTLVATTSTDINGKYKVVLPPGNYYIYPSLNGYDFTLENVGSDDTIDSDFDKNDTYGYFSLVENQKLVYDVGMYKLPDFELTSDRNLTTHGITTINKVLRLAELRNVNSNGAMKLAVSGSSRLTINWNPTATILDSQPVNNADWNYIGAPSGTHIWEYIPNSGIFPANGVSHIGITYEYNPQGNTGLTNISFFLNSGAEANYANGNATDVLTFFAV
jgi:hypothetical protein